MKNTAFIIIGVTLLSSAGYAQQKPFGGLPETNPYKNLHVTMGLNILANGSYEYYLDDVRTKPVPDTTFTVKEDSYELFKKAWEAMRDSEKFKPIIDTSINSEQETNRLYYFFKTAQQLAPGLMHRPEAGKLSVSGGLTIESVMANDKYIRRRAGRAIRKREHNNEAITTRWFRKVVYKGELYARKDLKRRIAQEMLEEIVKVKEKKYVEAVDTYGETLSKLDDTVFILEKSKTLLDDDKKKLAETNNQLFEAQALLKQMVGNLYKDINSQKLSLEIAGIDNVNLKKLSVETFVTDYALYKGALQQEPNRIKEILKAMQTKRVEYENQLKNAKDSAERVSLSRDLVDIGRQQDMWNNALNVLERLNKSEVDALNTQYKKIEDQSKKIKNLEERIRKYDEAVKEANKSYVKLENSVKLLLAEQQIKLTELGRASINKYRFAFNVTQADIEFNDGLIENILVVGTVSPHQIKYYNRNYQRKDTSLTEISGRLKFENRYPIGFSRKRDFDEIKNKYLYIVENGQSKYRMRVSSLLEMYYQRHEVDRRDFFPADTVLRITFDKTQPLQQTHALYKEQNFKLLEARIFTDFVGLDKSNPNGLIQTELSKKISLITNRFTFRNDGYKIWNFGFLGHIVPQVTLSKIEQNNKELTVRYRDVLVNGEFFPAKYASTLELKRYENFSIGFDLNLGLVDIPSMKLTIYLDAGFRYGRVAVVDSLRDYKPELNLSVKNGRFISYGVNTTQFYPRLYFLIRSDERYTFSVSGSVNWYYLRSNAFDQVANESVFADSGVCGHDKRIFGNLTMLATLKTKDTERGKWFFRYQHNWQFHYANTGFHQAQVGYAFYVFGRKN